MLPDRIFYPLAALAAAALIALALVWPRGEGAPSSKSFGPKTDAAVAPIQGAS